MTLPARGGHLGHDLGADTAGAELFRQQRRDACPVIGDDQRSVVEAGQGQAARRRGHGPDGVAAQGAVAQFSRLARRGKRLRRGDGPDLARLRRKGGGHGGPRDSGYGDGRGGGGDGRGGLGGWHGGGNGRAARATELTGFLGDRTQGPQAGEGAQVDTGHVTGLFPDGGQDLDLLDGVDPEVGFQVHVHIQHLGRVTGALRDNGEQQRTDAFGVQRPRGG